MPAVTHFKTKTISSATFSPLATPDGSSLEEQLNTFLLTLDSSNVLDVLVESHSGGKYGLTTNYFATVVYRG